MLQTKFLEDMANMAPTFARADPLREKLKANGPSRSM
jgi:hypothetical protein